MNIIWRKEIQYQKVGLLFCLWSDLFLLFFLFEEYLITEPFDATKIDNSKNVNLVLGIFGASAEFWSKATGEDELIETPAKRL